MADEGRWGRLRGAMALDSSAYRDIAGDPGAIRAALFIVVAATLLAGLGGLLWTGRLSQDTTLPGEFWGGFTSPNFIYATDVDRFISHSIILGGTLQVVSWLAWVGVTQLYLWAFGESPSFPRLARVMGYAFAPIGLQLFVFPNGMELAAGALSFGYCCAAMVIAVEAAAGTSRGRAAVAVLAGFAFFAIALSLLGSGNRDLAPGVFSLNPLPISVATRTAP
jgi:hypothetical protein